MKRKVYDILRDGKIEAVKYSWNSARRQIRLIVKSELNKIETAELFSVVHAPDFSEGSEIWHTSDGRTLVFQIKQVQ